MFESLDPPLEPSRRDCCSGAGTRGLRKRWQGLKRLAGERLRIGFVFFFSRTEERTSIRGYVGPEADAARREARATLGQSGLLASDFVGFSSSVYVKARLWVLWLEFKRC